MDFRGYFDLTAAESTPFLDTEIFELTYRPDFGPLPGVVRFDVPDQRELYEGEHTAVFECDRRTLDCADKPDAPRSFVVKPGENSPRYSPLGVTTRRALNDWRDESASQAIGEALNSINQPRRSGDRASPLRRHRWTRIPLSPPN